MDNQSYSLFVAGICKDGHKILEEMGPWQAEILHMAIGISGEAGELLDAIKKAAIYQKDMDRENVIEELGDLEFYMQGLRSLMDISRKETIDKNREKLERRYPNGYSNASAQERADKNA